MSPALRNFLKRSCTVVLGLRQRSATARAGQHTFRLALNSYMDWQRARTFATKEPDTIAWIQQHVRPGDVFYDVGANIGVFSLYAGRHVAPGGAVHAFEPEALNFAQLNKNVALNQLAGTVRTHCLAVSDTTGLDELYFHPGHLTSADDGAPLTSGAALHSIGSPTDHRGTQFRPAHRQGIYCVTLDALWQGLGLAFPTHVKIDVDGGEARILRGAAQTLRDRRLRSLLVESSDSAFIDRATADFASLGFRRIHPAAAPAGRVFANAIFVREP
ncbi:MAG TPA: FkbM family methyltransferase [Opitutaceae bacterium]|nr:FkbM family methyltransferase [Opitutaceae bacterium]